jgi:N utilization substance protein A
MRPAPGRSHRGNSQAPAGSQESLLGALEALSADVGVPREELLRTVESALAVAYQRAFEPEGDVSVRLDPDSGEMVVTSLNTAADGTVTETPLPVEEFRRLAAQTARGAVLRCLRDLERNQALSEVSRHYGELASGLVDRIERGTAYIDLGKVEGWMPQEEQIPGEELRPGRPVTVVILDASPHRRQAQVRVSRASRAFVLRLLEAEVPEMSAGTVQVKAVAREPGLRTKIAVASSEPGIDPVGACVGPKGMRHRSLLSELGPEHVDIVPYDDAPEGFVAAALGPATVVAVEADQESRTATVRVPRDQLSLAIGRDGQNARLAAKLTGWRVDIKAVEDGEEPTA